MKRILALLLACVLLVSLTACKKAEEAPAEPLSELIPEIAQNIPAGDEAQPSDGASQDGDTASESTPPAPEDQPITTPDELRGSWTLSDANDMDALEAAFPGVSQSGGALEIGADGLMFWVIGTAGGAGSFTVDGEKVSCQLVSDHNGVVETVPFFLDDSGPTLVMEYNGATIYWAPVLPPR